VRPRVARLMSTAAPLRAAALLAALALAGCEDPYSHNRTAPPGARTSPRVATPSDIAQPASPAKTSAETERSGLRPSSARAAARSFAWRWVNWSWRTAARQQRALGRLADGDLARQLLANAESARIDATLARDKPGSGGTVAAVQLTARGRRAWGIVVTREQTLTDDHPDLGGQHYRVYTVRLVHDRRRWKASAWTPQP
jgi:hypothetical protein